jgi:hypothetical protein
MPSRTWLRVSIWIEQMPVTRNLLPRICVLGDHALGQNGGEDGISRGQHQVKVGGSQVVANQLAVDLNQIGIVIAFENLLDGDRHSHNGRAFSGDFEHRVGEGRLIVIRSRKAHNVNQIAQIEERILSRLNANSATHVLNAERGTGPLESHISAQVYAMERSGILIPMQ